MSTSSKLTTLDRFRGCLLGGAVGDALGAPVEFLPLDEIVQTYGPDGPADLVDGAFPAGSLTDDTQMTLFVAEGVIRSLNSWAKHGDVPPIEVFLDAHWRWLTTQGRFPFGVDKEKALGSWLTGVRELNEDRAAGETCITALESGEIGTLENPLNDSKGCGGVMRVAPVGLAWPGDSFLCGCEVAALTHGHPTGWLSSGCMALIIHELVTGVDLEPAVERAMAELENYPDNEETLSALEHALAFEALGLGNADEVECLGGGWIAEQALARRAGSRDCRVLRPHRSGLRVRRSPRDHPLGRLRLHGFHHRPAPRYASRSRGDSRPLAGKAGAPRGDRHRRHRSPRGRRQRGQALRPQTLPTGVNNPTHPAAERLCYRVVAGPKGPAYKGCQETCRRVL